VAEIEGRITAQRVRIAEVLRVMERQRRVIKVAPDLYFDADYLLTVEQLLRERWQDAAEITPAAFRDAIGTTRKYAIPLLEYFDRKGVTERTKAGRRLRAADQRHPARAGSEAATQESCESSLERKS
jgi:selenocysteine-specific elongation factor